MIPEASPTVPPVAITIFAWNIFALCNFKKWGRTDECKEGMCENSDHFRPNCGSAEWIKNLNQVLRMTLKQFKICYQRYLIHFSISWNNYYAKMKTFITVIFNYSLCFEISNLDISVQSIYSVVTAISYPRNLAPAGPNSKTLLAIASPSMRGGGWINLSFFRYLKEWKIKI